MIMNLYHCVCVFILCTLLHVLFIIQHVTRMYTDYHCYNLYTVHGAQLCMHETQIGIITCSAQWYRNKTEPWIF